MRKIPHTITGCPSGATTQPETDTSTSSARTGWALDEQPPKTTADRRTQTIPDRVISSL